MFFEHYFTDAFSDPKAALVIIVNLIIVEGLLSIDNAAVLATMVMDLPQKQRSRALRIGLILGYIFRGTCLIFASFLIKIWWLKLLGGLYLLYLAIDYFITKKTPDQSDDLLNKQERFPYKYLIRFMSPFWATVIMVETMDLAFSLDNVFAAVAYTDKILLVTIGVFIGILCMRFVAGIFVKLMERYPDLETSAFIVLFILGVKLSVAAPLQLNRFKDTTLAHFMERESTDLIFSVTTIVVFLVPIVLAFFRKK